MGLSPSFVEWLGLIRFQVLTAEEQSRQPAPSNVLAINTIQDAVEAILSLTLQHKGGEVRDRPDFLQLFDAVMDRLGKPDMLVAFRPSLSAMNTARVNFKHHGNAPAASTLQRHVERGADFVREICTIGLGQDFDSVSLLAFVQNDEVRGHLEDARSHWSASQADKATESLRLAFDFLVRDYTQRKVWHSGKSLYSTKPTFFPHLRELGLEKIGEWLENLDRWVRYLALGVDMRQYAFFDAHTPGVSMTLAGTHSTHHREGITVNDETFERCFKFVIDTGLAFAADDFEYDAHDARIRAYKKNAGDGDV